LIDRIPQEVQRSIREAFQQRRNPDFVRRKLAGFSAPSQTQTVFDVAKTIATEPEALAFARIINPNFVPSSLASPSSQQTDDFGQPLDYESGGVDPEADTPTPWRTPYRDTSQSQEPRAADSADDESVNFGQDLDARPAQQSSEASLNNIPGTSGQARDLSARSPQPEGTPGNTSADEEKTDDDRDSGSRVNLPRSNGSIRTKLGNLFKREAKTKIGKSIASKFATRLAFRAAISSPAFWAIVGIIILIIGIIFGTMALFGAFNKRTTNGVNGTTTLNDAKSDTPSRDWAKKTLMATGDADSLDSINQDVFGEMKQELLNLKEQTSNADIKQKIDSTILKIEQYLAARDKLKSGEVLTKSEEILRMIEDVFPKVKGRYPIDPAKISAFNNDLHLGTPLQPATFPEEEGHGTYMYYGEGKADAVDLMTNEEVDIFSILPGDVVDISDDGTGNKKIVIKSGEYEILYAHLTTDKKVGDKIADTSSPIGKIAETDNTRYLHMEVAYCGINLTTTEFDKVMKSKQTTTPWGQFLWERIKRTFEL